MNALIFVILIIVIVLAWKFLLGEQIPNPLPVADFEFLNLETNKMQKFPSHTETPSLYLSVVVPAYNEEKRICKMLDDTVSYLRERQSRDASFTYEIIVVDDGSSDSTAKTVHDYCRAQKIDSNTLRVLVLKRNRGKGGALRCGMMNIRGKYALMADADGATQFRDIETLEKALKGIEKDGFGIVCGSRHHMVKSDTVAERAWYRNITMYGFHMLVYTLCVKGIEDTQCGFKLFTRKTAHSLFSHLHIERWAFDVEMLYLAERKKIPIVEVPVNWKEIDGSHLSVVSATLQMAKDLIRIRLLYVSGYWK